MSAIVVTLFESDTTSAIPIVLGSVDDSRQHGLSGLSGDEDRAVQVDEMFRAEQVEIFDRKNRNEGLSLTVHKIHATMADAFRWWLLHPRSCPIKVDAMFEQDGVEEWLLGCGIAKIKRVERPGGGVTTIFAYDLVGGKWAPARNGSYSEIGPQQS